MAAPEGISAFRAYSKPFDTNKGVQSFTQIYDSGYIWENGSNVQQTGAWRPLFASDFVQPAPVINVSGLSLSGVTIDTTALQTIATSGVVLQTALSGQVDQINNKLTTLVNNAAVWQKVSSSGYVSSFTPTTGSTLINKIQGVSKTSVNPSYILVYDGPTGAGNFPVASIAVLQNNNWFIDLAEAGVRFTNNLTIINSADAVNPVQYGTPDFFCTVVYK